MTKKRKIIINKKAKTDLEKYPMVECKWHDIQSDSSWRSMRDLEHDELPICFTKGHLLSQSKGITRIFGDYSLTKDNNIDEIGNTTIIPTNVIIEIKKL